MLRQHKTSELGYCWTDALTRAAVSRSVVRGGLELTPRSRQPAEPGRENWVEQGGREPVQ